LSKLTDHQRTAEAGKPLDEKIDAMCKQLAAMERTLNYIFVAFVLLALLL
jgi:hypothetical protein